MSEVERYAVFGNPIAHSKSPEIHTAFAEQTGQAIEYTKILVPEDDFSGHADKFFKAGGLGLNVTVPFKLDALSFADALSQRAKLAGAVNTLIKLEDGSIRGDNTDGIGLVRDIQVELGWPIKGKRVLILGAGGAVRGAGFLRLRDGRQRHHGLPARPLAPPGPSPARRAGLP